MQDSIDELIQVLYYAQETENQALINICAQDIAWKLKEQNSHLNYKELLYQYGYNDTKKR